MSVIARTQTANSQRLDDLLLVCNDDDDVDDHDDDDLRVF